jgi:hypothetical protein
MKSRRNPLNKIWPFETSHFALTVRPAKSRVPRGVAGEPIEHSGPGCDARGRPDPIRPKSVPDEEIFAPLYLRLHPLGCGVVSRDTAPVVLTTKDPYFAMCELPAGRSEAKLATRLDP